MTTKLFITAATLALVGCSQEQAAPIVYPTEHIRIDNSDSNLVASDPEFARVVARRLASRISGLKPGTFVELRSFGDVNGDNNLRYVRQILPRSYPADRVAREVAETIIANAENGGGTQGSTEIIAELTWGEFDCGAGDGIILLSDGIPTGQITSQQAVLDGGEALPEPNSGVLDGCSVSIWGLGRTQDSQLTSPQINNLRAAWEAWMQIAGAEFTAITNP